MSDDSIMANDVGREGDLARHLGSRDDARFILPVLLLLSPMLYTQLPSGFFLPMHMVVELTWILLIVRAIAASMVGRHREGTTGLLIPALLATGLLDFVHLLSLPGMSDFITPNTATKAIYFWLASRLGIACVLVSAPVLAVRSVHPVGQWWGRYVFIPGLSLIVFWVVVFSEKRLPALSVPTSRTAIFQVAAEYAVIGLGSLVGYFYLRRARNGHDGTSLLTLLLILGLCEWGFALFSDAGNLYYWAVYVCSIMTCIFVFLAMFSAGDHAYLRHQSTKPAQPRNEHAISSLCMWPGNGEVPLRAVAAEGRPQDSNAVERILEQCLYAANSYARNLLDANLDAMLVVNLDGRVIDANRVAEEATGASRGRLYGMDVAECFVQKELARAVLRRAFLEGSVRDCALSIQHATGKRTDVMCGVTLHCGDDGQAKGAFVVARDVTDLLQYETQMSFQATCDALTALPNRLQFRERLGDAMKRADRDGCMVSMMFIDLDNFKDVNEMLGHAVGDELLKEVANILIDAIQTTDSVARMGGDEFAVMVEGVSDLSVVEQLANRLRDALGTVHVIDGHELTVTCSIGIALYPADGNDIDVLLRNVDTAMYRAKSEGKDNFQYFTSEMNDCMRRRVEIGNALRRAMKASEFTLHYQPRVELAGGAVVGAEALIRWNSADIGAVSPAEFIPIAESNGLIVGIGEWVLRRACHQARQWQEITQLPIPVAVNLSARQFRDADIVKVVIGALNDSGLPAHLLELELTETMLMHDVKRVSRTLRGLKEIGVRLAVDDFGTGYSSLNYLKSFPLDYLKVDQSFINDIPHDPNDEAIVRAIIAMAHGLGIKVIAEGVETDAQLAFLLEQDCDEIQGYYFSRPLSDAHMVALLKESRRLDLERIVGVFSRSSAGC